MKKKIYDILKEEIVTLRLAPGEPLIEERLAERFKVSRTPVREVIRRLNHEGFAEIIPQKGAFVAKIGFSDVREIFQIREVLEGLAAKNSASRFSNEELDELESSLNTEDSNEIEKVGEKLHSAILEKAKNERLLSLIGSLKAQIERMLFLTKKVSGTEIKCSEEHREILQALRMGNGELAEKAMRKHIRRTAQVIIELLSKG